MSEIICARHGRTSKTVSGLCGEPRSSFDRTDTPAVAALRVALGLDQAICGRAPLPECSACHHPQHEKKCSTIAGYGDAGTVWCACEGR